METVYVLWHVRRNGDHVEDSKMIGVYRADETARAAIARLSDQPGFVKYPEGFEVSAYELDKDHWVEGFGFD